MPLPAVITGTAAGSIAGVALWRWLRTGSYRIDEDEPRLTLPRAWVTIPAAAAAGGLAGLMQSPWLAIVAWVYLVGGVAVTWIDLDVHRVPDRVLRWWAPTLLLAVAAGCGLGPAGWGALRTAVTAAAITALLFLGLALVGSMGLGDVKLAGVTGLVLGTLGWAAVTTGVVAAFAVGTAAGIWLMARGASRTSHLAFGPAIVVGAAIAVARAGFGS